MCKSRKENDSHTSSLLGKDTNEGQVFPQRLKKVIQVQLHPTTAENKNTGKLTL